VVTRVDDTMTIAALVAVLAEHDVLLVRVGRRRPEDGRSSLPWLAVLEDRCGMHERPLRYEGGGGDLADAIEDALAAVRMWRERNAREGGVL
jgi:hypothetical protein